MGESRPEPQKDNNLQIFDEEIQDIRRKKEAAINAGNFEKAATLRDDEKRATQARAEAEAKALARATERGFVLGQSGIENPAGTITLSDAEIEQEVTSFLGSLGIQQDPAEN